MRRKKWIVCGILTGIGLVGFLMGILSASREKNVNADTDEKVYAEQSVLQEEAVSANTDESIYAEQSISQEEPADAWELILVNRWNPIPEGYEVELTQLQGNQAVDSRIYPSLQQMFDDARAEGIYPMISSSYRTYEEQLGLMEEKIAEYQNAGYAPEEVKRLAEEWVALPGTSEHQIGLAVDITTADPDVQDVFTVWQWLTQNSHRYGFILRYPEDKTEITGVMHEQWHFRYVGEEAAKEIYEQNLCLEEYKEMFAF